TYRVFPILSAKILRPFSLFSVTVVRGDFLGIGDGEGDGDGIGVGVGFGGIGVGDGDGFGVGEGEGPGPAKAPVEMRARQSGIPMKFDKRIRHSFFLVLGIL
ncbi:MAG: hypothetical protein ACXVCD_01530, partial [Pseudobdellovibrionaceae bacterium]